MTSYSDCSLSFSPGNPPNRGITFVDHASAGRSGHLGHALVEYAPDRLLAFYPNCAGEPNDGHNAVGWMEYKRSTDGGTSWSDPLPFEYSKAVYENGGRSVMTENAVRADNGAVLAVNLECDIAENGLWRPYGVPTYLRSEDGGDTWSDPRALSDEPGRVYDVIRDGDDILALEFENDATDTWTGTRETDVYGLHASTDAGRSFDRRSTLPFDTDGRGYGALTTLPDSRLVAYIYHEENETRLEYLTSTDGGRSWSEIGTTPLAKKIRNPQVTRYGDRYLLHGRSGSYGYASGNFVLYTSEDGLNWDDGTYLRMQEAGAGAYSESLVVGKLDQQSEPRVLIQASHAYEGSKTNVQHWWLTRREGH